ncbi:MAG: hemolysin family protein [Candidatus Omnitrophica bacterium]|nr:hemolysin family protein [Candidatus Omnitrophota bacterium]
MNAASTFLVLVVLFSLSFFFSISETALFALSKLDKKKLKDRYPARSKGIFEHLQAPRKTLGTVLVGNLIVNTWATSIVTLLCLEFWGQERLGIAMALMTAFLILFCEIFPKILAVRSRIQIALIIAPPLQFFAVLLAPFRLGMRFLSERILSFLIREKVDHSDMISEKELKILVRIGEEEGVFRGQERYMIQKLLDLGERPVKDIMTPRTDIVGLDIEETAEFHEEVIKKYKFSKVPVFQGSLDQVLGVVNTQDYLLREPVAPVKEMIREAFFVPESKRIDHLLEMFRNRGDDLAICVDEYGGTAGIVTQEDILEEIFGEFYDEYAQVEQPIRPLAEGMFLVEGKVPLYEFNEYFAARLSSEDANTLGGYLLEKMGVVPAKGAKYSTEDFEFTVHTMIRQRIHQIQVRRKA